MNRSTTAHQSEESGQLQGPPDVTMPKSSTQDGGNPASEGIVLNTNQSTLLEEDSAVDEKGGSVIKTEEKAFPSADFEKTALETNIEDRTQKKDYFARLFNRRPSSGASSTSSTGAFQTIKRKVRKFAKFVGPGFLVSVAYIDPGRLLTL
jgi:hypothetical protein